MSGNITQDQDEARSFEERVISILNALRQDIHKVDERVQTLEAKSYDTKPIWERALAEIVEVRREVNEARSTIERGFRSLERKLDVFNQDLLDLRDQYRRLEDSIQKQM